MNGRGNGLIAALPKTGSALKVRLVAISFCLAVPAEAAVAAVATVRAERSCRDMEGWAVFPLGVHGLGAAEEVEAIPVRDLASASGRRQP